MQRSTRQRQAILDVLTQSERPLSVAEILLEASHQIRTLGVATVYRTLKTLQDEEKVTQVSIAGNAPYYELAHKHHHHHFQCETCHQVMDIDDCLLDEKKLTHALKRSGLQMRAHEITLFGLCADCR